MEQENGNEDEIVNMSFLPKYLDWLIVQSKKKLLSNMIMILIVDLGNVTCVIQGLMRLAFSV